LAACAASLLLLAGCPAARTPTCEGTHAKAPGGPCSAYYYKAAYGSGGGVTQALTDCNFEDGRLGGNIVAFRGLAHGIGLRWLDARTLEVAVPDGVTLDNRREKDLYRGYALTYRYRRLLPGEAEFVGCTPSP